jgi:hypothetical protein
MDLMDQRRLISRTITKKPTISRPSITSWIIETNSSSNNIIDHLFFMHLRNYMWFSISSLGGNFFRKVAEYSIGHDVMLFGVGVRRTTGRL